MSYTTDPGRKATQIEVPASEAHLHKGCLEVLKLALRDLPAQNGMGVETRRRIQEQIKAIERGLR